MRQRATVGSLLPDGSVSLLVQRVSACTGDCGHCGGCGAVGQSVQVTARAPFPVEPGERVWVESRSGAVLGAAALVYLLVRRNKYDDERLTVSSVEAASRRAAVK